MRVLHVVPTYLPAVRYGGPIHSVHRLCAALVQQGHVVDVATTSVDGDADSAVALGVRVDIDGVGVHYFESRRLRRLYYAPAMRAWLRQRIAGYDAVHLHSVFLWPTLVAARAAERSAVPYVLSPRGMLVRELVRARSRWLKTLWIALFERRTLRRAAAIHLTSSVERAAFDAFGFSDAAAIEVIPNGVDCAETNVTPPSAAGRASGDYVLLLGRISWKKRIDRAIDAIAAVPGLGLVVAGGDDERLRPELERHALRLGVDARVCFTGHVDGERKQALLQGALALLMVSSNENYGNVVLEAMAQGTPALVLPGIGAADAVRAADAGWVVDDAPGALAAALQRIATAPELAREAGRRGADWVRATAQWPAIAERMGALYRNIAGGGAKAQACSN
jgi:glycosyltransferase involved in cell wall biosynthesis